MAYSFDRFFPHYPTTPRKEFLSLSVIGINRMSARKHNIGATEEVTEDLRLFERFLRGDDDAFHAFFRRHNPRLLTYCVKLLGSLQAAEDMAQEAWMRVIDLRAGRYDPVRNPVGFLIRIARNLCLDYQKSRKRLQPLQDAGEAVHASYTMHEQTTDAELVLLCMERLSFEYRETLVLNIHCGYSFEEIAQMLEKSPDAIWARASRARKKLRELVMAAMQREEAELTVITKQRKGER